MLRSLALLLLSFLTARCSTFATPSQEQILSELTRDYKSSPEADELFLLKSQNSLSMPHNRSEARTKTRRL